MIKQLSDDEIRIELKKFVERFRSDMVRELSKVQFDAASGVGSTADTTDAHLQALNDKIEQSKVDTSDVCQQMIDFIDRQ